MAPFHFQIEAAWHHAVWGLEAAKTGVFAPPALVGPVPFADLQAMMGKAETALEAFTPDEVNGWAGKDLDLQIGPRRLAFTSETLILSFSLPNFHFHAVTAYDILRSRGVPLGKRDYEVRCGHAPSLEVRLPPMADTDATDADATARMARAIVRAPPGTLGAAADRRCVV